MPPKKKKLFGSEKEGKNVPLTSFFGAVPPPKKAGRRTRNSRKAGRRKGVYTSKSDLAGKLAVPAVMAMANAAALTAAALAVAGTSMAHPAATFNAVTKAATKAVSSR